MLNHATSAAVLQLRIRTFDGCISLHFSTTSAARAGRSVRSLKLLTVILQEY
jgi:hypothetical protein